MSLLPLTVLLPILAIHRQFSLATTSRQKSPGGQISPAGFGAMLLLCGFAMFENPLVNAPWPYGKAALQRGENWRFALQELPPPQRADALLFLFPNLVEDGRLVDNRDDAFVDYTSFPLHGLYKLPRNRESGHRWRVVPRSTLQTPRLSDLDVSSLVEQRHAFVIVRGSLDLTTAILDEFADRLSPYGLTFDALVDVYGTVIVIELTVTDS